MDPVEIVRLFANPYTAVVAVLAAAVDEAPEDWLPESLQRWIGWLCVLACAPVAAGFGADVAQALLGGFLGLGGSWLLVEAVRARRSIRPPTPTVLRHPDGRLALVSSGVHFVDDRHLSKETNMDHEYAPEHETENPKRLPTPTDDEPKPAEDDEPPPIHPPPPVKK